MIYLNNLDLNQNELQNAVIQVLATAPSNPKLGQIYYNSVDKLQYQYDGTSWVAVGAPYTLPTMTSTVKGGAKLGNGLSVASDTLSLGTPSTITTSTTNSVTGTTHTHALTGVQPTITGAATTVTTSNLTANLALVSNSSGKIATSSTTATELGYLSGTTSNIQSQLNNIPKYNYLTGISGTTTLDPTTATQAQIDAVVIPLIEAAYTSPVQWNAIVVALTFTPSDIVKDLLYYYNGTSWIFLYYTTTGVQLANGTTAGLIQEATSNTDISLTDGVGTVNQSTKLRNARTFGLSGVTATSQSFDGSGNVTIPVTAVPSSLITGTLGVAHGGTGATTLTSGQALIGNGTGAVTTRAIDTTSGGTASSNSLITSGAVKSGLQSVISQIPLSVTKTVNTFSTSSTTATYTVTGYIINVMIVDSVTKEQVITDISYPNITTTVNNQVTITTSVAPTNALYVIITAIATS